MSESQKIVEKITGVWVQALRGMLKPKWIAVVISTQRRILRRNYFYNFGPAASQINRILVSIANLQIVRTKQPPIRITPPADYTADSDISRPSRVRVAILRRLSPISDRLRQVAQRLGGQTTQQVGEQFPKQVSQSLGAKTTQQAGGNFTEKQALPRLDDQPTQEVKKQFMAVAPSLSSTRSLQNYMRTILKPLTVSSPYKASQIPLESQSRKILTEKEKQEELQVEGLVEKSRVISEQGPQPINGTYSSVEKSDIEIKAYLGYSTLISELISINTNVAKTFEEALTSVTSSRVDFPQVTTKPGIGAISEGVAGSQRNMNLLIDAFLVQQKFLDGIVAESNIRSEIGGNILSYGISEESPQEPETIPPPFRGSRATQIYPFVQSKVIQSTRSLLTALSNLYSTQTTKQTRPTFTLDVKSLQSRIYNLTNLPRQIMHKTWLLEDSLGGIYHSRAPRIQTDSTVDEYEQVKEQIPSGSSLPFETPSEIRGGTEDADYLSTPSKSEVAFGFPGMRLNIVQALGNTRARASDTTTMGTTLSRIQKTINKPQKQIAFTAYLLNSYVSSTNQRRVLGLEAVHPANRGSMGSIKLTDVLSIAYAPMFREQVRASEVSSGEGHTRYSPPLEVSVETDIESLDIRELERRIAKVLKEEARRYGIN